MISVLWALAYFSEHYDLQLEPFCGANNFKIHFYERASEIEYYENIMHEV